MKAVIGIQGSGKSAYCIDMQLKERKNYVKLINNIEGFKGYDNIYYDSLSKFYDEFIYELYALYKDKASDMALLEVWSKFWNIEPKQDILIVHDEAHNIYGKKNEALLWFVTYHRHLYCEVVLITQNYKLIHSDYHIINDVVVIYPPYKQYYSSKIRFARHTMFPPKEANFLENDSIKKGQNLFNLYTSGGAVKSKSFLFKFIFMMIVLFGLSGFIFWYMFLAGTPTVVVSEPIVEMKSISSSSEPLKSFSSSKIETTVINNNVSLPSNPKYHTITMYESTFSIDNSFAKDLPLSNYSYLKKALSIDEISTVNYGYGIIKKNVVLDEDLLVKMFDFSKDDISKVVKNNI